MFSDVFVPIFLSTVTAAIIPILMHLFFEKNTLNAFAIMLVSVVMALLSIWCFGLNKNEKSFVLNILKSKVKF